LNPTSPSPTIYLSKIKIIMLVQEPFILGFSKLGGVPPINCWKILKKLIRNSSD